MSSKDKCAVKQCVPEKICNPASGICVLRTGAIGKKLVAPTPPKKSEIKKNVREVKVAPSTPPPKISKIKKIVREVKRRSNLPTWVDIQESAHRKHSGNRQRVQEEINLLADELEKPFNRKTKVWERAPKKKDITRHVAAWQNSGFIHVAEARRFGKNLGKLEVQMNHALVSHMKNSSLRAPTLPVKATTKTLWRGMVVTPETYNTIKTSKIWHDKSFMAFSRNRGIAEHSADPKRIQNRYHPTEQYRLEGKTVGILWKLDVTDVQRGTPWIWYGDIETTRGARVMGLGADGFQFKPVKQHKMINKTWAPSQGRLGYQEETLLPPGTLHVIHKPLKTKTGRTYVIRVKFVPDPVLESLYINPFTQKPNVSIDLKPKVNDKAHNNTALQAQQYRAIFGA